MAVSILASGVSLDPAVTGSVAHATRAARACLGRAPREVDAIDLLVDVGVYRDENIVEPAMAAMIQHELGIHLDYRGSQGGRPTLSFDLMNGACGLLTAVHVLSAILVTGKARYALVISCDAHPSGRPDARFPYASCGAALLLGHHEGPGGFGPVHFASGLGQSPVHGYLDLAGMGVEGAKTITVEGGPTTFGRLPDRAASIVRTCLSAEAADLEHTMIVTSRPQPGFADQLAGRLGISRDRVVSSRGTVSDPHTSALSIAFHQIATESADARHDGPLLFLALGPGDAAACAAYRPVSSASGTNPGRR
ncbi:hypothetical protein [Actinomadura rubrisoli]|uniref:Beta-ketoacyl-[acyl-carrier-protein] synthase III N-terminal domain-containing protein n=1 Tax=Actinomadura rubrisoli TaxID=2530368 RepID=A0A4R5C9B2_9ACTN|nr:hypothetical protein [Actinomadura rubrisoli]TDD96451.1 hypothetical protein E1298_03145 [Actinomadura rubrisoli]